MMSEFPSFIFPSDSRSYNKDNQQVFADYGCWEAADVSYCEDRPVVFARKHRPTHTRTSPFALQPASVEPCILIPEHDFLMLGHPVPVKDLLDDDVNLTDLLKERVTRTERRHPKDGVFSSPIRRRARNHTGSFYFVTTSIQDHLNHLATNYPELTQENFQTIMKECCPNFKLQFRSFYPGHVNKFFGHIDPSLCDVGRNLLTECVEEQLQHDLVKTYADRDYSGGCVRYICLEKGANKQLGAIVYPQGQGLDELSVKLLSVDLSGKKSESGSDQEDSYDNDCQDSLCLLPSFGAGPEIRQSLNGRVLQVDVASADGTSNFIIGTRSDHHILLNSFDSSNVNFDNMEKSLRNEALAPLGLLKTSGDSHVTSIALSPYITGECIVATGDRTIRLWSPDIDKNTNSMKGSLEHLEVLLTGTMAGLRSSNPWRQVCFAAHPRQLYITDDENASLFDLRTRDTSRSLLDILTSRHCKEHEKIYSIESCSSIGNEYEILVATNYNLFLVDQRHAGEPLLQWGTNMTFPPMYIKPTIVCDSEHYSVSSRCNWSYSASAILLGNQRAHEVYCYQVCKTATSSTSENCTKIYPPQAVGPPRILGSFKDVRTYLEAQRNENYEYLKKRMSNMIIGIETIPITAKTSEVTSPGLVVLQLNSVGDIGYQTLMMTDPEKAYDTANIITGKTSMTFKSRGEERRSWKLDCVKRDNYEAWAKEATKNISNIVVDPSEAKSSFFNKQVISHRELQISEMSFSNVTTDVEMAMLSKKCELCLTRPILSVTLPNENCDVEKCLKCQSIAETSDRMLNLLRKTENSVLTRAVLQDVENHDPSESSMNSEVRKLNLLNVEEDVDDTELGRLLKSTWRGSYEDYWNSQRQLELRRREEEQVEQDRQTFDLSQRSSAAESQEEVFSALKAKDNQSPPKKRRKNGQEIGLRGMPSFLNMISAQKKTLTPAKPASTPGSLAESRSSSTDQESGSLLIGTFEPSSPSRNPFQGSPAYSFFSPKKHGSPVQIPSIAEDIALTTTRVRNTNSSPTKVTKKKKRSRHSLGF